MIWPLKNKTPDNSRGARLETQRLILRAARLDDYTQWRSVRKRNYAYLKPFEPAWPASCLEEDFFDSRVARMDQDREQDRAYPFLIFKKGDQALIGGININNVVRGAGQYAQLGYWLDEKSQGNGYMAESAHAVLLYAFTVLKLARMNAATLSHNHKSRAMLERTGFVEEGFARAYIQIDGTRQDHVLYGLNAPDFLSAA